MSGLLCLDSRRQGSNLILNLILISWGTYFLSPGHASDLMLRILLLVSLSLVHASFFAEKPGAHSGWPEPVILDVVPGCEDCIFVS